MHADRAVPPYRRTVLAFPKCDGNGDCGMPVTCATRALDTAQIVVGVGRIEVAVVASEVVLQVRTAVRGFRAKRCADSLAHLQVGQLCARGTKSADVVHMRASLRQTARAEESEDGHVHNGCWQDEPHSSRALAI